MQCTHLEVLLKHGQFELFAALRIIWIHHDPLAHYISCKDANAVLALSANWLTILEELLSQLVHLKRVKVERQRIITSEKNEEGCKESRGELNRRQRHPFSSLQGRSDQYFASMSNTTCCQPLVHRAKEKKMN